MTDSDLKRFNRIFAQDLGRTPNGHDPLFKWARTRDLYYLIEAPVDMRTPGGLYVTVNGYRKITWEERIGSGWVVATWRAPGTESQWKAQYGTALPYPPEGMYYPIPNSRIPCDPNVEITMEAISKIREQRDESFESTLSRCEAEMKAADAKTQADLSDEIDSDWPAFDGQPMSRPYPKDKEIVLQ